jgi:hypothetical protein
MKGPDQMARILRIWLQQPLAFARVGRSPTPLPAFRWTEPDVRPRGTGKTAIMPSPAFEVDRCTGEMQRMADQQLTLFKDKDGIRPVCPFFELHGEWEGQRPEDGTAVTNRVLAACGLSLSDLTWKIRHANHKAYSLTHSEGDRVEADAEFKGDDFTRHVLEGRSPQGAATPLVLPGKMIPMGEIQAVLPTDAHPTVRVRFYAPVGDAYAPTDVLDRLKRKNGLIDHAIALFKLNANWKDFDLPDGNRILNPGAAWANYKLVTWSQLGAALPRIVTNFRSVKALAAKVQRSELVRFLIGPAGDAGKLPPGLYASMIGQGAWISSLGIIDDMGDGIVSCEIAGVSSVARARIVVAPPQFSPDRRPPVSIADGLADRVGRQDVRAPDWVEGKNWAHAQAEVDDLLDRAFETAGASNIDAWYKVLKSENQSNAVYRGDPDPPKWFGVRLWERRWTRTVVDLPLTEAGRWRHRRNTSDEFFEQLLRDDKKVVEEWIRTPDDDKALYYDQRMPALMRGSDRRPMHLTRRQIEAFVKWVKELRRRQSEERAR